MLRSMYSCSVLINVLGLATCTRPSSTGTTALRVLVLVHVVLQPAVQIVATMSRHSDSSFQRLQGRPGGCHRPPLAGLIAQHGGRGVLRRQLYADFLVCVVVVLLALLRGGESI